MLRRIREDPVDVEHDDEVGSARLPMQRMNSGRQRMPILGVSSNEAAAISVTS